MAAATHAAAPSRHRTASLRARARARIAPITAAARQRIDRFCADPEPLILTVGCLAALFVVGLITAENLGLLAIPTSTTP